MDLHNHDIVGFTERLDRFIIELHKSSSAKTSQLGAADRARLNSYLAALEHYRNWVVAAPILDLPESHPQSYEVSAALPVDIKSIENEAIQDVVRILGLLRIELLGSQSALMSAGLIPFDVVRLSAIIDKIKKFLTEYVDKATPLDLPESSPQVVA